MNKREALAAAKRLGIDLDADVTTTAGILAEIQTKVDRTFDDLTEASGEDDTASEHAFLVAAGELGFVPTEPVREGDLPAEPPETIDGEVVDETDDETLAAQPRPDPDEADGADIPAEIADEVGAAVALREHALEPVTGLPTPSEFNAALAVANEMADTGFVPASYRGRPADVFAAIMVGRELGLGFMTAMRDVHMIDGRPAIAAHRQLALMRRGGVVILESESSATRAWIRARRSDTGEVMAVEFTMEEAEKIVRKNKRLVDGDNWRSYPADMLWARCVGRLTRRLGPDLLNGLPAYVAEEVADFSGWGVSYGEGQELNLQQERLRQDDIPEYRKEYPDYNWPNSFPEIVSRFGEQVGADETIVWLTQARLAMYPDSENVGSLGIAEKQILGQRLSSVLADLDTNGIDEILVGVRGKVQEAFARKLGGTILDGPGWALDPEEAESPDWPLKEDVVGRPAAQPVEEPPPDDPGHQGAEGPAGEPAEGDGETVVDDRYVEEDIPFEPRETG